MKLTLFSFFIISSSLFLGQSSQIIILQEVDNSPISYCNVFSYRNKITQYSDINGHAFVNRRVIDTILLRHTGFYDTILIISNMTDTIRLRKKTYKLSEVKIRKYSQELQLGNFQYKKMNRMHNWLSAEFLRRIEISQMRETYKVNSIFIPMGFNSDYDDSCLCKVHLYKPTGGNEMEDVLKSSVILSRKNIKKDFLIDISDQDLYLEDSILYIGLDCFLIIPYQVKNNSLNYDLVRYKAYAKHIKTSPIWFYFDMNQVKYDKENGLSFMRIKDEIYRKASKSKWIPTWFTAGIVVKTF